MPALSLVIKLLTASCTVLRILPTLPTMQLLILVTLALTWTSSVLVTARPILDTSIIVPRTSGPPLKRKRPDSVPLAGARDAHPPSPKRVKVPDIVDLQSEYWHKPGVPVPDSTGRQKVTFAVDGVPQEATVHGWQGIPNFVAYQLYILTQHRSRDPRKRDPVLAPWPVLVLAYTTRIHNLQPLELSTLPLDQKWPTPASIQTLETASSTWSGANRPSHGSYPVFYAASRDPPGYDVGTSVWRHLLKILQDEPGDGRYYWLIFQIAKANPHLSEMLYIDSKFHLLDQNTKFWHFGNAHLPQSEDPFKHLLKVIVTVHPPPAGAHRH